VVQISPPIQSIESPEARQSASLSSDHEKTEKKGDAGVFARLLAGLLQKTGKSGAESAAPGAEKPEKTPSGRAGKGLSLAEDTPEIAGGVTPETGEVLESPEGSRKGKKSKASPLMKGETPEGIGKTDALSGKEKKRVKSPAPDGADAGLAAEAALARSVPETGGAVESEGEVAQAGQEDLIRAGTGAGGEGIPDIPVPGNGEVLALVEDARQDHAGSQDRELSAGELPGEELARYVAEALPSETSGSVRTSLLPGRENAERDGRNSGEIRTRDRRRDRPGLEARGDIRAGLDKRHEAEGVSYQAEAGKGEEGVHDKGRETELVVELRSMGKTQAEISAERENRPLQSFQSTLARELHENLNGDIVRHASVMLRDGGEGTIRLSLRPETLGSVKIRLEITENKIAGRIIVESGEAFKAFEEELHSLEQSFRDSGFDDASLEMAFASDGQEGRRQRDADSGFSGHLAALRYDAAISGVLESPEEVQWREMRPDSQGRPLVNILV
jgi:hypothetical protein